MPTWTFSRTTRFILTKSFHKEPLQTKFHVKSLMASFFRFFLRWIRALKQKSQKHSRPRCTSRCEWWVWLQLDEGSFIFQARQASILWPCIKVRLVPGGLACSWRDMMAWLVTQKALLFVLYIFVIFVSCGGSCSASLVTKVNKVNKDNKQWLI